MRKLGAAVWVFISFFTCNEVYSQTMSEAWARTAGGTDADAGKSIAVDHQGGVYVGGYFSSSVFTIGTTTLSNSNATGTDAFIAKFDASGNVLWAKSFGGVDNQSILSIALSPAGNMYVGGIGFNLAKLDNSGNIIWQVPGTNSSTASPDQGIYYTVAIDSRENVYVGQLNPDVSVFKYNSNGVFRFSKLMPHPQGNSSGTICIDRLDNLHIAYYADASTFNVGPPTNQNISPVYSIRIMFDSLGVYLGHGSLFPNPRDFVCSYNAKYPGEYFVTKRTVGLNGLLANEQSGGNLTGLSIGFGCFTAANKPKYAGDHIGNEFYSGDMWFGSPVCNVTYALGYSPLPTIPTTTGYDIYFMRKTGAGPQSLNSTLLNGNTNEFSSNLAVDTVAHTLYIIGSWSTIIDTSKFRFGGALLTNAGNTDILLLKLSYGSSPLTVNAGPDRGVCPGGSIGMNTTVSGGTGGYTYNWSPTTGVSNPGIANPIITSTSSPIDYILTVTDNSSAVARDTVRIQIDSNLYRPTISLTTGSNPFCEGMPAISLTSSPAVSYLWNTGATAQTIFVTSSNTFTVTATNSDGCVGVSLPYATIMKPRPLPPIVTPPDPVQICAGSSVTLTAQTTQPGATAFWYVNPTGGPSITVSSAGTYNAGASLNGCNSVDVPRTVTVNSLPVGNISGNDTAICEGDSVLLSVNTSAGNTILWNTGATTQSIWVKTAASYSAILTSPAGCTNTTNTRAVLVTPKPLAPTIIPAAPVQICAGSTVTLTAQSTQTGVTFIWTPTNTTNPSITVSAAGTYSAAALLNGCASSYVSRIVTVNSLPAGSIAGNDTAICSGDSVLLTINTTTGNTILWNTGAITQNIWVKTTGTYSAVLTSPQGCTRTTNTKTVTVMSRPSPSISQSGNVLTANPAGVTYQWYLNGTAISGATSQALTITQGGSYSVLVIAGSGCAASAGLDAVYRIIAPGLSYQVYPNPVTSDLNIIYTLEQASQVSIILRDNIGQKMSVIVNQQNQSAGEHRITFSNAAVRLQKGFYLLEFTIGSEKIVRKILIL